MRRGLRNLLKAPERRRWWAYFGVFFALGSLWALADPPFGSPDEISHTVRAAAASRGQILGRPVEGEADAVLAVDAPEYLATAGDQTECWVTKPGAVPGCAGPYSDRGRDIPVGTSAGRHPPLYYVMVGLPSALFHSAQGMYLSRIVSAALVGALLASAFASLGLLREARWMAATATYAVTPMALFLAGSVNPNGIEIAAAIAVWATGLVMVTRLPSLVDRRTLSRFALGASLLVLMRGLSPLWLAAIVVVLTVAGNRDVERLIIRDRRYLVTFGIVGLATVIAVVWILAVGGLGVTGKPHDASLIAILRVSFGKTEAATLRQIVGVFNWLDSPGPALSYLIWIGVSGMLLFTAFAGGKARELLALAGLVAFAFIAPVLLESLKANAAGFVWQGRYSIPIVAGIPILAGTIGAKSVPPGIERRLAAILVGCWGLAQVLSFAWAGRRVTVGYAGPLLYFLDPTWTGPVHPAVLLVSYGVATALGCLLLLRHGVPHAGAVAGDAGLGAPISSQRKDAGDVSRVPAS